MIYRFRQHILHPKQQTQQLHRILVLILLPYILVRSCIIAGPGLSTPQARHVHEPYSASSSANPGYGTQQQYALAYNPPIYLHSLIKYKEKNQGDMYWHFKRTFVHFIISCWLKISREWSMWRKRYSRHTGSKWCATVRKYTLSQMWKQSHWKKVDNYNGQNHSNWNHDDNLVMSWYNLELII